MQGIRVFALLSVLLLAGCTTGPPQEAGGENETVRNETRRDVPEGAIRVESPLPCDPTAPEAYHAGNVRLQTLFRREPRQVAFVLARALDDRLENGTQDESPNIMRTERGFIRYQNESGMPTWTYTRDGRFRFADRDEVVAWAMQVLNQTGIRGVGAARTEAYGNDGGVTGTIYPRFEHGTFGQGAGFAVSERSLFYTLYPWYDLANATPNRTADNLTETARAFTECERERDRKLGDNTGILEATELAEYAVRNDSLAAVVEVTYSARGTTPCTEVTLTVLVDAVTGSIHDYRTPVCIEKA